MGFVKFKNIIAGWSNLVFKNPVIEEIAIARILICCDCEYAIQSHWFEAIEGHKEKTKKIGTVCTQCSCPIQAKARVPIEPCPKGKWEAKSAEQPPESIKAQQYIDTITKAMEKISVSYSVVKTKLSSDDRQKIKDTYSLICHNYEALKNTIFSIETERGDIPNSSPPQDTTYHKRVPSAYKIDVNNFERSMFQILQELHKVAGDILRTFDTNKLVYVNRGEQQKTPALIEIENDLLNNTQALISIIKRYAV